MEHEVVLDSGQVLGPSDAGLVAVRSGRLGLINEHDVAASVWETGHCLCLLDWDGDRSSLRALEPDTQCLVVPEAKLRPLLPLAPPLRQYCLHVAVHGRPTCDPCAAAPTCPSNQ